jgi:hypothetical protein
MNNKMFFTIALNFLVGVLSSMSVQLRTDLEAAIPQVVLQNQVLEIKKEITGNSPELLSSNTQNEEGICSFDTGGKLDVGRAFVFDQVAIGYATNAASGLEGDIEYNTKAPKELQNALVIIEQEGREVLRMPFRDLHNIQTGEKASDEYTELKALGYFVDGKKVKITIKLAEGVSLASGVKHYVYFRASGLQTAKKA